MQQRKRVLFVGSFAPPGQYQNIGGVMFACQTLVNSNLGDKIEWLLIDSTSPTVENSNWLKRIFGP